MIKAKMKRTMLSAAVALVAAVAMPGPAMAQYHTGTDTLYIYTYYSDSTYTTDIGTDRDTCNRWGLGRTATQGSSSNYVVMDPYALCVDGQYQPY